MSSLAVGRGLERELCWLGGLFTAAELAAADLLLKFGGDDEEEAAASARADTSSYSRRFPSSRREDLTVVDEESKDERAVKDAATASAATPFSSTRSASSCCQVPVEEEEPRLIVQETAPSLGSVELDRRARKRYRLLWELYAATRPVTSSSAAAKKRIRKVHGDDGAGTVESSGDQATRNVEGLVVRARKGFCVITP